MYACKFELEREREREREKGRGKERKVRRVNRETRVLSYPGKHRQGMERLLCFNFDMYRFQFLLLYLPITLLNL